MSLPRVGGTGFPTADDGAVRAWESTKGGRNGIPNRLAPWKCAGGVYQGGRNGIPNASAVGMTAV